MGFKYMSPEGYAAFIPFYCNGNAVKAVSTGGEVSVINKGIKAVMRDLQKSCNMDIKSFRHNFSRYIGRVNTIPIPLTLENVFIPVKVRKTIGINDGCFAYVNLKSIEEVSGEGNAKVKLLCKITVECMESKKIVAKRIDVGYIVKEKFEAMVLGQTRVKEALIDLASEYNSPATKADIAIIARELMLIKSRLG